MRAALALSLVLLAGAVQAQEVNPEEATKLVEAITKAGCTVTAENNADILAKAGLADKDAQSVVNALLGLGQAEIVDGNLRLKTEGCK